MPRRTTKLVVPVSPTPDRRGPIVFLVLLAAVLWGVHSIWHGKGSEPVARSADPFTLRERIADALDESLQKRELPREIDFRVGESFTKTGVIYTLDWKLQQFMEKLFSQYRPDYGAFVAMDAETGQVLSLVSYSRYSADLGHLALKASFPAASVFKIVTAAAALDKGRLTPSSSIPFNGGMHTLYRRNVNQTEENRWTRNVTLAEAFAKSINTVFAKIGMHMLRPPDLREYAEKFQFNQPIPADVRVDPSHFELPDDDPWAVAEVASGFNRVATMSPLQGALIGAAVANEGVMMSPYLVDRLYSMEDGIVYRAEPAQLSVTVSPDTANGLRSLMKETVRIGTSRSVFRQLFRRRGFEDLEVGGKTGSLQGFNPKGKYDWFVGYARSKDRKIAVSALTINEEKWQVKSSYLAKAYIEEFFREAK